MTETRERRERKDEAQREAQGAVRDLLSSWVWREVAVPSLRQRLRALELALALGQARAVEEMRFMQGQHALLRELLTQPQPLLSTMGEAIEEG